MTIPLSPHAVIELGDKTLDTWAEGNRVVGVEVELCTGEASKASLRVHDPAPAFEFINSITSADGVKELQARVWLGFGETRELGPPVFKGMLACVEREGGATVCRFYDMGFQMRKLQRTEYHKDLTDLQIIRKLAERNGLKFQGPDKAIPLDKHKSLKQEGDTDWTLAQSCAERAGLVLYVRGDTLFAQEAAVTAETPLLTLRYREDFHLLDDFRLSFKVPENQEGRPARVETRGRGRGGRRLRGESGQHPRGAERLEIKRDLHVKSKRHADKRAEARKALEREHAFSCSVGVLPAFTGRRADVRDTVALANLPRIFNGKYLVDSVTHVFEAGQLSQELDLYRDIKL